MKALLIRGVAKSRLPVPAVRKPNSHIGMDAAIVLSGKRRCEMLATVDKTMPTATGCQSQSINVCHVVAGQLNKQIAADLGIAEKTIKIHRARVMVKMGTRSLAELVGMAARIGISASQGASARKI